MCDFGVSQSSTGSNQPVSVQVRVERQQSAPTGKRYFDVYRARCHACKYAAVPLLSLPKPSHRYRAEEVETHCRKGWSGLIDPARWQVSHHRRTRGRPPFLAEPALGRPFLHSRSTAQDPVALAERAEYVIWSAVCQAPVFVIDDQPGDVMIWGE